MNWLIAGEESSARVRLLRFVFFALVGVDSWAQISHASRYGAGRFNVSHLPALDPWLPAPEPSWILLSYVLQAFLAFCVALGVSVRRNLALLALLNGLTYFCSQLDSYQHHFLLWLMLTALAGAAWLEPDRRDLPPWSLRVLRLQVAITYFWTTVTKMDPLWWSGETLATQLRTEDVRTWIESAASVADVPVLTVFAAMSWLTILAETALAAAFVWPRRLGWLLWPVGVVFHLTVEHSGFEIGLFSYYMVSLYILLLPERLLAPLERLLDALPTREALTRWLPDRGWAIVGGAVTLGLLLMVPLDVAATLALIGGLLAFTSRASAYNGLAQIAAAGAVLACHAGSDQVRDYYRFMGGDARQRAEWDVAKFAYGQVVRIDPSYASSWLRLGDLHAQDGDFEDAIKALERAADADPGSTAALQRLLAIHEGRGDRAAAERAAQRLLSIDPKDERAQRYR
ncbi:MAG: HTTM domain-containing protein [Alphaproteobacteria bacterium]|nr:HTTM domain-containing protein [Alphaproteobacteria bacterium]